MKGGPLAGKCILVAEDDFFVAEAVREALEEAGAVVAGPFPSVHLANWLATSVRIDGAVLDLRLSDGSGAEVAQHLRALKVPFFVYSGMPRSHVPASLHDVPFLAKPRVAREVVAMAESLFEAGAARKTFAD